jgi:hypothetical protein
LSFERLAGSVFDTSKQKKQAFFRIQPENYAQLIILPENVKLFTGNFFKIFSDCSSH